MQKLNGATYDPEGLMQDPDLRARNLIRPTTGIMFDWFHVYLASGIWNVELFLLFSTLGVVHYKSFPKAWDVLHSFVHRFHWPKASVAANTVFNNKRRPDSKSDHVKCSASEGLGLYLIISLFLRRIVPDGVCTPQVKSYLALAEVLDLLVLIKMGTVDHDTLRKKILHHLRLFQKAYGNIGWIPKHHMALHLWRMMRLHAMLLSCFVHERRHKFIKRYICQRFNSRSFELGLMEDLTLQHLHDLKGFEPNGPPITLLNPHKKTKKQIVAAVKQRVRDARDIVSASGAIVDCAEFRAGDVVILQDQMVGEVVFFARIDNQHFAFLLMWSRRASDTYTISLDVRYYT